MPQASTLQLECPAKVNLALSIGAPLANGYHPLASWMVAVAFADRLSLEHSSGKSEFNITFAADAPVKAVVDWPLEKDLAFLAHQLLEQHVGRALPIRLSLTKRIPTGAGLGGGSSDAAGVLVGVNKLHELNLGEETLISLGQRLGSDVAFLVGAIGGTNKNTSAVVTGLGEKIAPAPLGCPIHLVLIFPSFGCPTGEVYRAFDQLRPAARGPRQADEKRVGTLAANPILTDRLFNDLAGAACIARPELGRILTDLSVKLDGPIHVTGSGSTLFAVAPDGVTANNLARRATAATGLPAVATHTL